MPPRGENPEDIELHTLMRWAIRNVGVEEGVIHSHAAFQFSESRSSSSSKTEWGAWDLPS